MNVLVVGAYGFIGRHCASALVAEGHVVTCGGRAAHAQAEGSLRHRNVDFSIDVDSAAWETHLGGIDTVVNAVGAIGDHAGASLEVLHARAPIALFAACRVLGIRVVQISALGADADATSRFHLTKWAADDYLLRNDPNAVVLMPSLVYGLDGASARTFNALATLPLIPLPGTGMQSVQPVHVDDVAAAVCAAVGQPAGARGRIALVGPCPLTLREYLHALRRAMQLGRAHFIQIPFRLVDAALAAAVRLGVPWASTELIGMLNRCNVADPGSFTRLLGRPPRRVETFLDAGTRQPARRMAMFGWLMPVLRGAVAITWLATAAVSLGLYPLEDSVGVVQRIGLGRATSLVAVYVGATLDAVFGVLTLLGRGGRWMWAAQALVITGYTLILTIWLPELWRHPFGPLLKNIPMLGAIALLHAWERR